MPRKRRVDDWDYWAEGRYSEDEVLKREADKAFVITQKPFAVIDPKSEKEAKRFDTWNQLELEFAQGKIGFRTYKMVIWAKRYHPELKDLRFFMYPPGDDVIKAEERRNAIERKQAKASKSIRGRH
jgi:hypothetical protein